MIADLCVHNDKIPNGESQPHAHVMLTMRQVTPEGFGQKVREWNAKENLLVWREAWAPYLALTGDQLATYKKGEALERLWPKLSEKEQKRLEALANANGAETEESQ